MNYMCGRGLVVSLVCLVRVLGVCLARLDGEWLWVLLVVGTGDFHFDVFLWYTASQLTFRTQWIRRSLASLVSAFTGCSPYKSTGLNVLGKSSGLHCGIMACPMAARCALNSFVGLGSDMP